MHRLVTDRPEFDFFSKSMVLPTDKFRIKPGEEYLTRADFKYWPAWSEHYDFDEIKSIVSWGVDREWILSKFKEFDSGGSHPHYTILDLENLPLENMRIFLKASFEHASGITIDGYIMNEGDLAIVLFSPTRAYQFSKHPIFHDEMQNLLLDAEREYAISPLFPLKFSTQFKNSSNQSISGVYQL